MSSPAHVLIVEDDPLLRGLLAELLIGAGHDVRAVSNAPAAMAAVAEFDVRIALLDIDLGSGPSGIDLAHNLRNLHPDISLVFLTQYPDPRFAGLNSSGIPKNAGYVLKSQISDHRVLTQVIQDALGGVDSTIRNPKTNSALTKLSKTQLDVLKLVADGLTNEEIATLRGTSVRAVRGVVSRLAELLQVADTDGDRRVHLALAYIRYSMGFNAE